MNSLVVVNIYFVLLHILIFVNPTTAAGLGASSCRYSGNFDSGNEKCHKDVVKIDKLPKECTAYVFDGVLNNKDGQIVPRWMPEDLVHLKSLIDFEDRSHNVYLFYKHETREGWINALFFADYQVEAQKVLDFTVEYPVKGLILDGLENPFIPTNGGDFHKNFSGYVTAMKSKNPNLEIGLYLSAKILLHSKTQMTHSSWFRFDLINAVMDFYVIEFLTFNECTTDLVHGGITPIEASTPGILTLNKFAAAFEQSNIAKDKVYFELLVSPIPTTKERPNFQRCEFSYNEYCENREAYQDIWCADNQDILNKKGKFAKQYSNGFIASDIDLVDRDDKCECNNKYVTFYMILDGYNDVKTPLTCPAFL